MATTVVRAATIRPTPVRSMRHRILGWVLIYPLVFFAVHGTPSFESAGHSNVGGLAMSGLASSGHNGGFLGNVVLPGVAFSIVLLTIVINAKRIFALALQMKGFTVLALFTICSAVWSQDPLRSLLFGAIYLIETLFAFYLVLKFDSEELVTLIKMTGVSICVFSLIMVFLFPSHGLGQWGNSSAWLGVFTDRTSTGKCLVFLLSPALIFRRRLWSYPLVVYILLMFVMVFMAHAATARVLTLVYIAFMASITISSKFGRRSSLLIAGMFLTAGVSMGFVILQFLPRVLAALGRNATLTGRTDIWVLVMRSIAKRPLLGYGYYAFWQGLKGESGNIIVAAHWFFGYAHNGVLEIWLQLGLVGTALFFVTLVQALRNAWFCLRNGCSPGVEWYIGLIALTVMYNVDESTVLWPIDLSSVLYIVACSGLAIAVRQTKSVRKLEAMYN